ATDSTHVSRGDSPDTVDVRLRSRSTRHARPGRPIVVADRRTTALVANSPHVRSGRAPDAVEPLRDPGREARPTRAVIVEDRIAADDPYIRCGGAPDPEEK